MGEIDTRPIEPVQVALSFFGEKGDLSKHKSTSTSSNDSENEKEKENDVEGLLQDLANNRLQLEAKDSAYKQVLLNLEHYQMVSDELSTLLKQSEIDREKYIKEYAEARTRIDKLESKIKEMSHQLSETAKVREQLLHVLNELKAAHDDLLCMETELASARESQLKAITQAELMENAASMEKEKADELSRHVSELKEAILNSKLAAAESQKEKCEILSELDIATATAAQTQEQPEDLKRQMELMQLLEIQLLEKSIFSDLLLLELKKSNQLLNSSEKATFDAVNDLKQLKECMKIKEGEILDREIHIEALEMELSILKFEQKNAIEEKGSLMSNAEMLIDELQKTKIEMYEIKERETEAQVEIALLKSELHEGKSKIAVAEAAQSRAKSLKSGLCHGVEAENMNKENQKLNDRANKLFEEPETESVMINTEVENSLQNIVEILQADDESNTITISAKEYELLIKKAEKAHHNPAQSENNYELEILKKELEATVEKVGGLRNRSQQAVTRAEAAEKAKAALEQQIRRLQEQKQKRKAALVALKEVSVVSEHRLQNFPTYEKVPATYQPLGKVLNMKF